MSKAETLIERLTDAVAAHYAGDPSAAGLVVARLPNGQAYVSVVRYRGSHGQGKEVVTAAQRPTLREALIVVAEAWHRIASKGQKERVGNGSVAMILSDERLGTTGAVTNPCPGVTRGAARAS